MRIFDADNEKWCQIKIMTELHYIKCRIKQILLNGMFEILWCFSGNRRNNTCLNTRQRDKKVIVSLTSFPERIAISARTIRSILNQKDVKADRVILWLAVQQFPDKEKNLPVEILRLTSLGLEIRWCNDIRSYKKLIPALGEYPDDIIITADDDVIYGRRWLEYLYAGYKELPECIQCHRATKILLDSSGEYKCIAGGLQYYDKPAYCNKLVGVGGVLYPPHSLCRDVFKTDIFMKLAPTSDDIWFWLMAVLNKTKVHVVRNNTPDPLNVLGAEKTPKLSSVNDQGDRLFWVHFNNLLSAYPDFDEALRTEFEKLKTDEKISP